MASSSSDDVPRHDFFQTPTQVIVSIYIKGCSDDKVEFVLEEDWFELKEVGSNKTLKVKPLFGKVDKTNSSIKILPSKIEISLIKLQPGIQWPSLQRESFTQTPLESTFTITPTIAPSSSTTSSSSNNNIVPTGRTRSKWDSFKDEEEDEESEEKTGGASTKEEASGEASIDAFFKKLYADADDDTRRAMMKSYQESGGTSLSTNWDEVRKGKVETKPPQGMEARKW